MLENLCSDLCSHFVQEEIAKTTNLENYTSAFIFCHNYQVFKHCARLSNIRNSIWPSLQLLRYILHMRKLRWEKLGNSPTQLVRVSQGLKLWLPDAKSQTLPLCFIISLSTIYSINHFWCFVQRSQLPALQSANSFNQWFPRMALVKTQGLLKTLRTIILT